MQTYLPALLDKVTGILLSFSDLYILSNGKVNLSMIGHAMSINLEPLFLVLCSATCCFKFIAFLSKVIESLLSDRPRNNIILGLNSWIVFLILTPAESKFTGSDTV